MGTFSFRALNLYLTLPEIYTVHVLDVVLWKPQWERFISATHLPRLWEMLFICMIVVHFSIIKWSKCYLEIVIKPRGKVSQRIPGELEKRGMTLFLWTSSLSLYLFSPSLSIYLSRFIAKTPQFLISMFVTMATSLLLSLSLQYLTASISLPLYLYYIYTALSLSLYKVIYLSMYNFAELSEISIASYIYMMYMYILYIYIYI